MTMQLALIKGLLNLFYGIIWMIQADFRTRTGCR